MCFSKKCSKLRFLPQFFTAACRDRLLCRERVKSHFSFNLNLTALALILTFLNSEFIFIYNYIFNYN